VTTPRAWAAHARETLSIRLARLVDLPVARRRALIAAGVLFALGIWVVIVAAAEPYDWSRAGPGHDARPYWTAVFERPYATSRVGAHDAYLYSPLFLQVVAPLRALPWQWFLAGWTAILILATLYLVGPVLFGPALLLALPEIIGGNITLLLAVAIVAGFRRPGMWALPLLTKVTPGLGLLWFAVRREWRALTIAGGLTAAVAAISFLTTPDAWTEWFRVLASNAGSPIDSGSLPIPLLPRLAIAVVVIAWGARTDRRWALPIGCLLALPVIWYGSLSLLLAVVPLLAPRWTSWSWRETWAAAREWSRQRSRLPDTQGA
jgi:hypothetical protein